MIKNAKKFTYIILISLILFLLFNFSTWNFYTKDLISPENGYSSGDLARLSYFKNANEVKLNKIDLPRRHIKIKDYNGQKIDIVTIGDSFSSDVTGGLNPYYQDYLASIKNITVLNVPPYKDEGIVNTIIIMKNNGFLDKLKPKILILENVERTVGVILTKDLDLTQNVELNEFLEFYQKDNTVPDEENKFFEFISSANIRCYLFDLLYLLSDKPLDAQVYIKNTTKNLFSNFTNKILLVDGDIDYLEYNNYNNISRANENLNKIAEHISQLGTKLYFMPAVDKYESVEKFNMY